MEIGNGYGVPGGGAYIYGNAGPNVATPGWVYHQCKNTSHEYLPNQVGILTEKV